MGDIRRLLQNDTREQIQDHHFMQYERLYFGESDDEYATIMEDFNDRSIVTIAKFNDNGDRVKVPLIVGLNRIKKTDNPLKYAVLVFYVGSGRNNDAVGVLVSKFPESDLDIAADEKTETEGVVDPVVSAIKGAIGVDDEKAKSALSGIRLAKDGFIGATYDMSLQVGVGI